MKKMIAKDALKEFETCLAQREEGAHAKIRLQMFYEFENNMLSLISSENVWTYKEYNSIISELQKVVSLKHGKLHSAVKRRK
jgi:hypothetical protein